MYTKQQASLIRQKFWTSFGQYMRPVRGADGGQVNWLNYKTGIKHLYFRMDADKGQASVSIELRHPDLLMQSQYFERLKQVENILEELTGEQWSWKSHQTDDDGNIISSAGIVLRGMNIFNETDWPAIISFLKPRIVALAEFWNLVKDGLE